MATTITRYVNTGSTAGGDGTTSATSGANRAYATLNEAIDAQQRDLVAADEIALFLCSGTAADTVNPTFGSTWKCDGTRFIRIKADTGQEHGGKYNTSTYRIEITGTSGSISNVLPVTNVIHIKWEGIQFEFFVNTGTGNASWFQCPAGALAGQRMDFTKCIIKARRGTFSGSFRFLISSDSDFITRMACNICYDLDVDGGGVGGIFHAAINSSFIAYNCTFVNCARALNVNSTATNTLKNCLFKGCTVDITGSISTSSDYNATTLGSATANFGSHSRLSQTFTFADESTKDFHLASSDAGAKTFGVDLSADGSFPINYDVDGEIRAAPWDIGADQYSAPPGGVSRTDLTIRILA